MIKTCKICGKEFDGNAWVKICSDKCRREQKHQLEKAHRQREKTGLVKARGTRTTNEMTCIMCHKKFKPQFKNEKFCSDECRYSSPLYKPLVDKFRESGYYELQNRER